MHFKYVYIYIFPIKVEMIFSVRKKSVSGRQRKSVDFNSGRLTNRRNLCQIRQVKIREMLGQLKILVTLFETWPRPVEGFSDIKLL